MRDALRSALTEAMVVAGTSGKTSGKTPDKIIAALRADRHATIPRLAAEIGLSERSIERGLKKLQAEGRLRRRGAARNGYWEVV